MSRINEIFKPLYTSDKRYILATGGRASLKSSSVHDFICRLTYEQGHGILFTRYTMTSAEKSIIPEFKLTLSRLGIENDFYITKNVIKNLRTDSFILFSGIKTSSGDQTANLKSISGITTWVIEEGEDFRDEKAFDTIDDSIRTTEKQNRVIWIQNPTTQEHFIYQRWIKNTSRQIDVLGHKVTVSNHPDVEHIHSTYHIAKDYLSDAWIKKAENAEKTNPKWFYHNYIGGWLEKAEGVVFENWEEGEFNDYLPYCYGLDFGFHPDPLAIGKIAVDKGNKLIYVKEIAYEQHASTDRIINILDEYVFSDDLVICDTNEPRTTSEIKSYGYNIQKAQKNKIVDDIRRIQSFKIIVDPDSPNFKRELNNYVWNDKKASIPIDDFNHLIDQMRYSFNKLTNNYSIFA